MLANLQSKIRNPRLFRGFTLVELLVVIAIIGILVALLLPAVQAARESARRMQCANNLKQMGLAVLNYESTHRTFPPSAHWDAGADLASPNQTMLGPNWVILVLPFAEQQNLYNAFDLKVAKYIRRPENAKARGTQLPTMLCPSDTYNGQSFSGSLTTTMNNCSDGWARGNYAANAGNGLQNSTGCSNYHGMSNCGAFASSPAWKNKLLRGVMGANSSVSIAEVQDGTSHTILLGEIRAGVHAIDPRGCWAMSGPASALWGFGSFMGDVTGINPAGWGADNTGTCKQLAQTLSENTLFQLGMHCFDPTGPYTNFNQQTVKSMHVGGAQICLADGSVHFVGDFIDSMGDWDASPPALSVWDKLIASSDGQVITDGSY